MTMKLTLPATSYLDPQIFRDEQSRLFANAWQYVSHAGKLQRHGDYFVCDVAVQSLIVMQNSRG